MESTMTPLERAAWVYLAETGKLRQYLVGATTVEDYHVRLHQEAIRIGAMLRKGPVSPVEGAQPVLGT